MAGPLGVNPFINAGPISGLPSATLRIGQLLQGIVQGTPGNLVLAAAGLNIPLEESTPLLPGQSVIAQVVQNRDALQLRILPQQSPATPPQAALRPGQLLQGTVQGAPGNFVLVAAGLSIPLDEDTTFLPGQTVTARVVQNRDALQVRILPQHSPLSPPTTLATAPLPAIIEAVLASLGSLESVDTAKSLAPSALPVKEPALRTLLSLFVSRGSLADDLSRIASLVREAAGQSAIAPETARLFDEIVTRTIILDDRSFRAALEQAVRNGGKNIEAILSRALLSGLDPELGQQLETDLRSLIGSLRKSVELTSQLNSTGKLAEFERAAGSVLDRLSGTQLQNLHGGTSPYWFIELPFGADSPIRHAQIHVLSDGHGQRNASTGSDATVAFDLSTTRLGDLWINLSVCAGRCICSFRATDTAAVDAIQAAAGELVEKLSLAGYPGATVHASLWSGNRMIEAANLMRRFAGIDVTA